MNSSPTFLTLAAVTITTMAIAQDRGPLSSQPDIQRASDLIGQDVYSAPDSGSTPRSDQPYDRQSYNQGERQTGRRAETANEEIGEIEDLVVALRDGKVRYVAIRSDGRSRAVPLSKLRCTTSEDGPRLSISRSELARWPLLTEGNWPTYVSDTRTRSTSDSAWNRNESMKERSDRMVEASTSDRSGSRAGSTPSNQRLAGAPQVRRASEMLGMDVSNWPGEDLGEIEDLVVDCSSGQIRYSVLEVDTGFLGLGEKYFAIPLAKMRFNSSSEELLIAADPEEFENASGFDENRWPAQAEGRWRDDRIDTRVDSRRQDSRSTDRYYDEYRPQQDRFLDRDRNRYDTDRNRFDDNRYESDRSRYNDRRYDDRSQDRYRESRFQDSRYPDSRYPDSRYPDSRYQDSRYPDSRYPDSRYQDQDSRSRESRYPDEGRYQDSRYRDDRPYSGADDSHRSENAHPHVTGIWWMTWTPVQIDAQDIWRQGEVEEFTGNVKMVENASSTSSPMTLKVENSAGKTLKAITAPASYLREQGLNITEGARVELTGMSIGDVGHRDEGDRQDDRSSQDGAQKESDKVLFVSKIRSDGKEVRLRDDQGKPLWKEKDKNQDHKQKKQSSSPSSQSR